MCESGEDQTNERRETLFVWPHPSTSASEVKTSHIEERENLNCFPERDERLLLPPPLPLRAHIYGIAAVLTMQEEYYHLPILLNPLMKL